MHAIAYVAEGLIHDQDLAAHAYHYICRRGYEFLALIRDLDLAVALLVAGRATVITFVPREYDGRRLDVAPESSRDLAALRHNAHMDNATVALRYPKLRQGHTAEALVEDAARRWGYMTNSGHPQLGVVS